MSGFITVLGAGASQSSASQGYSTSASATSSSITNPTYLTNVQSGWSLYLLTHSNTRSTVDGGGNSSSNFVNQVSGVAYVDYTYHLGVSTPEPGTMALLGGALVGLAFLRKRVRE